jgi:hypothetical protein
LTNNSRKKRDAAYRKKHKAKLAAAAMRRYYANPERQIKRNRKWRIKNPGAHIPTRAIPVWADRESIEDIYRAAMAAEELFGIAVQVDHTVPLRSNSVCGLHCESNLQLLPAVVNAAKSNRVWPDMW